MTKRYYWIKLSQAFFNSKEIKKLRKIAGGDTYLIIYLKMQLLSLETGGKLYFDGLEDDFAEELALSLDEDVNNIRMTIAFMQKCGLIEQRAEGEFFMPEVLQNIGSESSSAARVRKHRELQCNEKALQCNTDVTKCNLIIDIDKDKEIDKDIDTDTEIDLKTKCASGEPDTPEQTKTEKKKTTRFVKPTVEQLRDYCNERQNGIDAEYFFDYYESNGWKVGKAPMKDWKATIRNWERRQYETGRSKKEETQDDFSKYDFVINQF